MPDRSLRFIIHWIAFAVLLLGLTPLARALDINGDGMDDIWQELYGIAPFDGRSDPDGDGLINLVESLSWSDPHDAPLILARIRIIEHNLPNAMDTVNADAFAEAYKDLQDMLARLR